MRNDILDTKNYNKIAIMGGTFDPIHYGHLVAAEAVRQELDIEKVIFIPTGNPPHKKGKKITHSEHRYLMTVLATVTNPYFDVSRIEIDRPGKTYTVDTIREIRDSFGEETEVFFITGADAMNEIITWKDTPELFKLCKFVAVTRPGYNKEKLLSNIERVERDYDAQILTIEIPALAISSTDIRNRSLAGKTIKYLLPEAVEDYITKFSIYTNELSANFGIINQRLYNYLTPKRFAHTQEVAQLSRKMAKCYGINKEKAYLAGLLHDVAKNFDDEEKLKLYEEYGLKQDTIILKQPELAHSFLGAVIAENEFLVNDEDILNAIRYHTTGRKNMSMLEKIVYLADMTEPTRRSFPQLEEIRQLLFTDIDKALTLALKSSIDFCKSKEVIIHPLSLEAYEYYNNILKQRG